MQKTPRSWSLLVLLSFSPLTQNTSDEKDAAVLEESAEETPPLKIVSQPPRVFAERSLSTHCTTSPAEGYSNKHQPSSPAATLGDSTSSPVSVCIKQETSDEELTDSGVSEPATSPQDQRTSEPVEKPMHPHVKLLLECEPPVRLSNHVPRETETEESLMTSFVMLADKELTDVIAWARQVPGECRSLIYSHSGRNRNQTALERPWLL